MSRKMRSGLGGIAATGKTDMSAIPAADLILLFHAIDCHREAGLCGHQHRHQPGCDAVTVWPNDRGATGDDRPAAVIVRDDRGQYRAFSGDGHLMALGSIQDVMGLWK